MGAITDAGLRKNLGKPVIRIWGNTEEIGSLSLDQKTLRFYLDTEEGNIELYYGDYVKIIRGPRWGTTYRYQRTSTFIV